MGLLKLVGTDLVTISVRLSGHYIFTSLLRENNNSIVAIQPEKSCFIFPFMQKVIPIPLPSLFNLSADYHHYSTRQRDILHIHCVKYFYSIRVQGPQIQWNGIPLSSRVSHTLSNYKSKLNDYDLSLQFLFPHSIIFYTCIMLTYITTFLPFLLFLFLAS